MPAQGKRPASPVLPRNLAQPGHRRRTQVAVFAALQSRRQRYGPGPPSARDDRPPHYSRQAWRDAPAVTALSLPSAGSFAPSRRQVGVQLGFAHLVVAGLDHVSGVDDKLAPFGDSGGCLSESLTGYPARLPSMSSVPWVLAHRVSVVVPAGAGRDHPADGGWLAVAE